MSRSAPSTFDPKVVLGMLLFGAIAFIAMLYFIGIGETGRGANDGRAHAASKGLTGYAALAQVLERDGHSVTLSRNAGDLDKGELVILTPPHGTDADELAQIIERRRYQGPTLVILPKWYAFRIPDLADVEAEEGWVQLGDASAPNWTEQLPGSMESALSVEDVSSRSSDWIGLGAAGSLPDPARTMAFDRASMVALVNDAKGRMLVGYLDDGGYYPLLDEAAGILSGDIDSLDGEMWNVTFVAEPDLFNNYGMADRNRAALAHEIVDLVMEGEDVDITFDLTLNGLGATQNLLTLAFTPPFLAATLCLLIAMIVVAWRAFRRFGPPLAEARAIAFGKSRLVANSAAFIQRTGRLHLLTRPYAALLAARIAKLLRLRGADEQAIDDALARRLPDTPSFSARAATLRAAKSKQETLRAGRALKQLEKELTS